MLRGFDILVLTASHEGQAEAYRAELHARNLSTCSLVVPDPQGRRVGSGVSTLVALAEVESLLRARGAAAGRAFEGRRVLIIHCGGDSRRLPAYAAHGKIFAPLPIETTDRRAPALLDLILEDMGRIKIPDEGRVVVATGDVFLDIGAHALGLEGRGITGVAWASSPERGSRHGVYICDALGRLTGFVHKPSPSEAERAGAVRPDGSVLVDTGVVALDPPTVEHWLRSAGRAPDGSTGPGLLLDASRGAARPLDLYGDILPAMVRREALADIDWRGEMEFRAAIVPTCAFLHIGSSGELLESLASQPPADERFVPRVRARLPEGVVVPPGVCVHNSVLEAAPAALGSRIVIEACDLRRAPHLAGSNIVVGVPPEVEERVELARGWGLVCLPVRDEIENAWTALVFGDRDDFKTPAQTGGTFGNVPLSDWLDHAGLEAGDVWPGLPASDRTLWTARLWAPRPGRDLLGPIGWMLRGGAAPEGWRRTARWNASELMARVDHGRLLAARGRVLDRV